MIWGGTYFVRWLIQQNSDLSSEHTMSLFAGIMIMCVLVIYNMIFSDKMDRVRILLLGVIFVSELFANLLMGQAHV